MDRLTPQAVSPEGMTALAAMVQMAQPGNGQLQQLGAAPQTMPSMSRPSELTLFLQKLLAKPAPGMIERPQHIGIRG